MVRLTLKTMLTTMKRHPLPAPPTSPAEHDYPRLVARPAPIFGSAIRPLILGTHVVFPPSSQRTSSPIPGVTRQEGRSLTAPALRQGLGTALYATRYALINLARRI